MFPLLCDSRNSKQGQFWVSIEVEFLASQELPDTTEQTLIWESGGCWVGFLFILNPTFADRPLKFVQAFEGGNAFNSINL